MNRFISKNKKILFLIFISTIFRINFLSPWLEDWDSVQFAQALDDFNLGKNQPHAPGYPIYILIAKLLNLFINNKALVLILISLISGALSTLLIYLLIKKMFGEITATFSSIIFSFLPIVWMTSCVGLTNMPGTLSLLIFLYIAYSSTNKNFISFIGGLILGIRATELPIVVLILTLIHLWVFDPKKIAESILSFCLGILTWIIPTIFITKLHNFIAAYSWITTYVLHHDSLISQNKDLFAAIEERARQLFYLLKTSYSKPLILVTIPVILLVSRKALDPKHKNMQFLFVWFIAYLVPLAFIFNLEVPRYTLPLAGPLVIFFSLFINFLRKKINPAVASIIFAIFFLSIFLQGLSQVTRYKNTLPPTIASVKFVKENYSPSNILVLASYTYRQFQHYAPEFSTYYSESPTQENLKNKNKVILDYFGLIDKISKEYNPKIVRSIEYSGDQDIFSRISKVTIYEVQLKTP